MYWNLIESNLIDLSRRYSATPIRMVGFPSAPLSSTRVVSRRRLQEAHGEFESEHPGYCGAQDTFYVRNLKGVGRVYQQTFIDTYAKVACAKLYDRKTPITAAKSEEDWGLMTMPPGEYRANLGFGVARRYH